MSKLFDHEHLRVYQGAIEFLAWLEGVVPSIKRSVSARDHLARASSGVPVNIAEASGKLSVNERRQFIDTAYSYTPISLAALAKGSGLHRFRANKFCGGDIFGWIYSREVSSMKNKQPMTLFLVVGMLWLLQSSALAGWDWETGGKAGYDSNLDRATHNPQGSGYLGAYLSGNRDPEGESRLDWTLSTLVDGAVYFNLSDLNYAAFTVAPGLSYFLHKDWSVTISPYLQAKSVADTDQSALAFGGKLLFKQKWGADFYSGQYYLYKDSRAEVDTYSLTENALGFFLGRKLTPKASGEIGYEFSRGDSFRAVDRTSAEPNAKGKGKGRDRRFSPAFGADVIRENVDRHALGVNVGVDWTAAFSSSAGYTFSTLQGDSGSSNDHAVWVSLGYRF
jgi:hypothetical protein